MPASQLVDVVPGGEGSVYPTVLSIGPAVQATIVAGVLTVTSSFVDVLGEGGAADQVDSIVFAGAPRGTLLYLHTPTVPADTITYDDANIKLGAATRAVAVGGILVLVKDEQNEWSEVAFTAGADHA